MRQDATLTEPKHWIAKLAEKLEGSAGTGISFFRQAAWRAKFFTLTIFELSAPMVLASALGFWMKALSKHGSPMGAKELAAIDHLRQAALATLLDRAGNLDMLRRCRTLGPAKGSETMSARERRELCLWLAGGARILPAHHFGLARIARSLIAAKALLLAMSIECEARLRAALSPETARAVELSRQRRLLDKLATAKRQWPLPAALKRFQHADAKALLGLDQIAKSRLDGPQAAKLAMSVRALASIGSEQADRFKNRFDKVACIHSICKGSTQLGENPVARTYLTLAIFGARLWTMHAKEALSRQAAGLDWIPLLDRFGLRENDALGYHFEFTSELWHPDDDPSPDGPMGWRPREGMPNLAQATLDFTHAMREMELGDKLGEALQNMEAAAEAFLLRQGLIGPKPIAPAESAQVAPRRPRRL